MNAARLGRALLLALALGLPALVLQLARPVPRLGADAVEYYAHLRSLYFDRDVDFANEFEHFGILERYDKIRPTPTGHRRTIFSIGPALLWLPFYAAGDALARLRGDVQDGYSPAHIRATCLGSLVYGVAGLLLVYTLVARLVPRAAALWSVVLAMYATFLWWYVVYEPVMSHAGSFFVAALVLRVWWDGRERLTWRRALSLGVLIGFGATVRWQNGVLLLLPLGSLVCEWLDRARLAAGARPQAFAWPLPALVARGLGILAAFALGALPQMLAWKAIFGAYLLADPPHGRDFLRLDHPWLLETFFSSRHGLFYWTPVFWAAYVGLVAFARRERRTGLALVAPVAVMTYVNACSGDWWAGGSYSNRRFDSLLPLLAAGLAVALAALRRFAARRPAAVVLAGGLALTLWSALFMQQYRRNLIPRDDTVEFARVAGNSAAVLADLVGTPLAWPANWIFAWRHDLPASRYDAMVGKYLFYRQNNLGGVIDLGDERADPALLDDAWSSLRACGPGAVCRAVRGSARLFAPLDVPETLDVSVVARGTGTLALAVNGAPAGAFPLAPDLQELRVRVPAERWRRELNELRFDVAPGDGASVDKVVFTRVAR
jgi:hypothetical protein